jgi:hypothetical protein
LPFLLSLAHQRGWLTFIKREWLDWRWLAEKAGLRRRREAAAPPAAAPPHGEAELSVTATEQARKDN